jgi:hypothetical protein
MLQQLVDKGPAQTCERTLKKYKAYCVEYKKTNKKHTREIFYQFADGFTVNNIFFNPKVGRNSLGLETGFKIVQVPRVDNNQTLVQ